MTQANQIVVLELGAGVDLPTIRHLSERMGSPLIRINPTHPAIRDDAGISLRMGAKEALLGIAKELAIQI